MESRDPALRWETCLCQYVTRKTVSLSSHLQTYDACPPCVTPCYPLDNCGLRIIQTVTSQTFGHSSCLQIHQGIASYSRSFAGGDCSNGTWHAATRALPTLARSPSIPRAR
eukprot:486564-Pleurochrysis_carterae.AAC.1